MASVGDPISPFFSANRGHYHCCSGVFKGAIAGASFEGAEGPSPLKEKEKERKKEKKEKKRKKNKKKERREL